MLKCPKCREILAAHHKKCPNCGYVFEVEPIKEVKIRKKRARKFN